MSRFLITSLLICFSLPGFTEINVATWDGTFGYSTTRIFENGDDFEIGIMGYTLNIEGTFDYQFHKVYARFAKKNCTLIHPRLSCKQNLEREGRDLVVGLRTSSASEAFTALNHDYESMEFSIGKKAVLKMRYRSSTKEDSISVNVRYVAHNPEPSVYGQEIIGSNPTPMYTARFSDSLRAFMNNTER